MPSPLSPSRSRSPRGFGKFRLDEVGDEQAFEIIKDALENAQKQHRCIDMLKATVQS